MKREPDAGKIKNAVLHVWGYFKNQATDNEKRIFKTKLDSFIVGTVSIASLKHYLYHLSLRYRQDYLLHSYYFIL
ncbi:DUF1722 domain-containing protein, partial [bacterium]|nr:DUF1722 domain-containing protein [bacterium]